MKIWSTPDLEFCYVKIQIWSTPDFKNGVNIITWKFCRFVGTLPFAYFKLPCSDCTKVTAKIVKKENIPINFIASTELYPVN